MDILPKFLAMRSLDSLLQSTLAHVVFTGVQQSAHYNSPLKRYTKGLPSKSTESGHRYCGLPVPISYLHFLTMSPAGDPYHLRIHPHP